jgi:hypothetical protein
MQIRVLFSAQKIRTFKLNTWFELKSDDGLIYYIYLLCIIFIHMYKTRCLYPDRTREMHALLFFDRPKGKKSLLRSKSRWKYYLEVILEKQDVKMKPGFK